MSEASSGVQPSSDCSASFRASAASHAISTATVWQRSSATDGVASRRSSSCVVVSTTFASGTSQLTSRSSSPEQGSSSAVHRMLKQECAMAMPYIVAASFKIGGAINARTAQNRIRPTTVPITLKER